VIGSRADAGGHSVSTSSTTGPVLERAGARGFLEWRQGLMIGFGSRWVTRLVAGLLGAALSLTIPIASAQSAAQLDALKSMSAVRSGGADEADGHRSRSRRVPQPTVHNPGKLRAALAAASLHAFGDRRSGSERSRVRPRDGVPALPNNSSPAILCCWMLICSAASPPR
jgi:hypothetical protein